MLDLTRQYKTRLTGILVDILGPVKTRSGLVYVVCSKLNGQRWLVDEEGNSIPSDAGHDVTPTASSPIIRYINIYPGGSCGQVYNSADEATAAAKTNRIACKKITIEYRDGEFDQ